VSLAFASNSEALDSFEQLLLNVFLLAAVAVFGIPAQRVLWRRFNQARPRPLID
jgi:hypothetical protein